MNADNTNILERWCIGCKRAISMQWTMYECECCRVTVCPECICAARLMTFRLNKIEVVSKSLGSTVIAQSLPPNNVAQLAKSADARVPTGSTANRVKRKPIPGTVSSTASTRSQLESRHGTNTGLAQNTSSSLPIPDPVQNAPSALTYQNPQHVYQPVSDHSQVGQPGGAPISQTSYLPERPAMLHAWTEPRTRQTTQNRTASNSQPSQQRPHLQHVRTAPMGAAGLSHNHRELSNNPIPGKSRPKFSKGNRRASLVATAKKVSHNKWVQAGTKMGAKLALGAVIGDAASGLVVNSGVSVAGGLGSLWNSNGSSNSISNTNNFVPNLFGDIGSNSNTNDPSSSNDVTTGLWNDNGSTLDVSNTNYTAPGFGSTNDLSSTNYIAPGFASNNSSFNDLSNSTGYDTMSQPDFSAPNYAQQEATYDTTSLEQNTSGTPIPDTSSINGNLTAPSDYTGYTYDASYPDPSQGGLGDEPDYAEDQLDSAQEGLSNAVCNEDVAVDDGANDAISASNAYVSDSINNANYALAYGPDAIPGESATPEYENADSDGV